MTLSASRAPIKKSLNKRSNSYFKSEHMDHSQAAVEQRKSFFKAAARSQRCFRWETVAISVPSLDVSPGRQSAESAYKSGSRFQRKSPNALGSDSDE